MHDIDPNPDIDDRAYFGWAITIVRERAGSTVCDFAKTAGIPVATVGDYFAGRPPPPLKIAGLLPGILRACGVDSPDLLDSWKTRLSAFAFPTAGARTPGGVVVALPLVSHAPPMPWRRRRGGGLTSADPVPHAGHASIIHDAVFAGSGSHPQPGFGKEN